MSLDFDNVTLLGISQGLEKFDSDFSFTRAKVISISGLLLDLNNTEGVKNIVEASELFARSTKTNLKELKINGVSYGLGYVSSFDVEGEHIRLANYSAELRVIEEGSLANIILAQNGSGSNNLSTNSNGITDEDLKYLKSFSEDFSFAVSSDNEVSLSHSVNCSFGHRESLISENNADWTGATVSTSKSKYLGNKGKGAILIAPNSQVSIKPTGLTETEYVLEFEYLGKNTNSANWGNVNVLFVGSQQSNKQLTSKGFYKVEFSPNPSTLTAGLFEIILGQDATYNTYFDNVKLYKKSETPVQKSKSLSKLLFDASPYYAVLEGNSDYQESTINLFDNYSIEEKFDSASLSFSASKVISHGSVIDKSGKKYSSIITTSNTFQESGMTEITESIEIKALKGKTETDLRSYIEEVELQSSDRVENKFENYNTFVEYDCPTPTTTQTPVSFSGFSLIKKSESIDLRGGAASLTLAYNNNPAFETTQYNNRSEISVSEGEGYNQIKISGVITGSGNSNSDRLDNARSFPFSWYLDTDLSNYISETKNIHSFVNDFYIVSKSFKSEESSGSITYDYLYTDSESGEYGGGKNTPGNVVLGGIIKSYEIEVSTKAKGVVYNEFFSGCQSFAQIRGSLLTPEEIVVRVSALGFYGKTPGFGFSSQAGELYSNIKKILKDKSLLFGEESELPMTDKTKEEWQLVNEFLSSESMTFSENEARLTYTRSTIAVGCPTTPTFTLHTPTPFYSEWIPPTDTPLIEYVFQDETPTHTFTILEYQGWGLDSITNSVAWASPSPNYTTGGPTPTPQGESLLSTWVNAPTPTPVETPTVTPEVTPPTPEPGTILVKRLIPADWNQTISALWESNPASPLGEISYGVKCLDDGGYNVYIAKSYADSTIVKDCHRSGNGEARFSELYFSAPDTEVTASAKAIGWHGGNQITGGPWVGASSHPDWPPTDGIVELNWLNEPCTYHLVEASKFYDGTIRDLTMMGYPTPFAIDSWELIGFYLADGQFKYHQTSVAEPSGDLDKYVILSDEYNERHPNYPKSGTTGYREPDEVIVVSGSFYFRNCNGNSNAKYTPRDQVEEVSVPPNWNNIIADLVPNSYGGYFDWANNPYGWELKGIKTCTGDIEHVSGPPLTNIFGGWYPTLRTDLNIGSLVDGCGLLSNLPLIQSLYFSRPGYFNWNMDTGEFE